MKVIDRRPEPSDEQVDRAIMFMWSSLSMDTFDIAQRLHVRESFVCRRLAAIRELKRT